PDKKFTSQFVDTRQDYYKEVEKLSEDKNGLSYVVGSDEVLVQNIELLRQQGIKSKQIMLDKRERQLSEFLTSDAVEEQSPFRHTSINLHDSPSLNNPSHRGYFYAYVFQDTVVLQVGTFNIIKSNSLSLLLLQLFT